MAQCAAAIHAGTSGFFGGPISGVPPLLRGRATRAAPCWVENDVRDWLFRLTGDNARAVKPLCANAAGGHPSVCRADDFFLAWNSRRRRISEHGLSRRTVAYHKEDSAASNSTRPFFPRISLAGVKDQPVAAADVNFIHLHSACLYPVDILLEEDSFDVLADSTSITGEWAAGLQPDRHIQEDSGRRPAAAALGRVLARRSGN